MRAWYALAIHTPLSLTPGPQYTPKTTKPGYDPNDRASTLNSSDLRGTSYELTAPTPHAVHPPTHKHDPQASLGSGKSRTDASHPTVPASSSVPKLDHPSHSQPSTQEAAIGLGPGHPEGVSRATPPGARPPMFSRRPTTTPVLLPEYRYCSRCQIVKPSRAHHCRACGTVRCFFFLDRPRVSR